MLVDPAELLDDCEQVWRTSGHPPVLGALTAEPRRMALVLDALVAYQLLARSEGLTEDTVFRRWPACTVGTVAHAGRDGAVMLAQQVSKARQRVLGAVPRPVRPGGPDEAVLTVPYVSIAPQWLEGAASAARALGWPWPLPKSTEPSSRPATGGLAAPPSSAEQPARAPVHPDAGCPDAAYASSAGHPAPARPSPPAPPPAGPVRPRAHAPLPAPELRLGAGGASVLLSLAAGSSQEWRLSADGESATARAPHWALPRPVRRIDATDPNGTVHRLAVVDPDVALLAFTADGSRLAPDEPLPADDVHLLHAGELDTDGVPVGVVELPTPYGWNGWTLSRLSLARVRRLRSGGSAPGRWLEIAVGGPLRWEGGERLRWVAHTDDAPVWSRPPLLRLPHRPGEAGREHWHVEVVRAGGGASSRLRGAPGALVDPWRDLPRPLLGLYEVVVRRDTTRGARRLTAFLADGVTATASPEWRLLAPGGGVAPAVVNVRASGTVTASTGRLAFAPYETGRTLELRSGSRACTVRAVVPHSELRLELDGQPRPWSIRPVDMDAADLSRGCVLTVRLPEQAVAVTPALALTVNGTDVHTVMPQRRVRTRKGDLRYSLTALADTMSGCPRAELRLLLAGERLLVGTVRTQPIAEGVEPGATGLRLLGLRHHGRLTARVHSALAPWAPPVMATVTPEGTIPLPSDWRDAGPVVARLLTGADPRPSAAAAGWPDLRDDDTLVLRRPQGVPGFVEGLEREMAVYLAGAGPLPQVPRALPYQWLIAARGRDLRSCGVREAAPAECLRALGVVPEQALVHAADAGLRSGELARVLVGSGLAVHRVRGVDEPETVRRVWRTAPLCALLLTAPLLPYLSGSGAYSLDELYPEEAELLDQVTEFLGDAARDLISGGDDRAHTVGRFGVQARVLDGMPEARQREVMRRAGLVPRALLDADTRAEAAWQAFRDRRALQAFAVRQEAPNRLKDLEALLGDGHDALAEALRRRSPDAPHGAQEAWMRVPQLSLGFALVARLAAWGDARAGEMEQRYRPLWTSIAAHAPDLTAVDLALAECLVAGEQSRRDGP
ncbi:hypothetical protein [Streptomyces sp. SP18CS02]|uniref:hypothetical protein n=1 Tax=Streptomyces sp. SP18CS02 TaxID=3002531 RepID=UPI002E786EA5|nr:hypothetical protein [Streptomyces sp. SP18CS02]MEE1752983.1 hypothetical protein [Streptomyces sp. SP18CS02]